MNDPVQHQLEAYKDRDLEAFMEAYAPDVRIEDGSGEEILKGFPEEIHAAVAYRVNDGAIDLVRMFM